MKFFWALFITLGLSADLAAACDLCALFQAGEIHELRDGAVNLGIAEQYTNYDKIQDSGHHQANPEDQHLDSFITQFVGAYDFSNTFGLQANIPLIHRNFARVEEGVKEHGSESGIGDISVLMRVEPWRYLSESSQVAIRFYGGVEVPSGDTDRLREDSAHEEVQEEHHDEDIEAHGLHLRHAEHDHGDEVQSVIHGHDLALGSGSWDFPIGLSIYARHDRILFMGSVNYVFRTEGDFDYRYADDLQWEAGPGIFIHTGHTGNLALRLNLSGEYKGYDSASGELDRATKIRTVFLGPELLFSFNDNISAEMGFDAPLDINNSGTQVVADYRLRFGFSYRFES